MQNAFRILLPSMANLVFLAVFLPIMYSANRHVLLGDTDTGIHIRAGEVTLEKLAIPKYDVFSFHSNSLPWASHEWLSQVIMALIHRAFGLTGIVIMFALIISSTYYLLFKVLCAENENALLCAFIVFLVIASSTLHWLARPHIFSLTFLLVYHYVLNIFQYRGRNYLVVLPLLTLLWVNLHGGFIVGLILLGVYLVGNLVTIPFLRGAKRAAITAKIPALTATLLGCLFISLINPSGYHLLTLPFNKVTDTFVMNHVSEFLSPNFHETMPFRYLLFLTIAIFAVSGSKADIIELALVLLFTHMALYSARHIPLFAIVVSPILARHAGSWLETSDRNPFNYVFRNRLRSVAIADARLKGWFWPTAALIAALVGVINGTIRFRFDERANPVGAIEFLRSTNLPGNMFNNETFGDYVIYTVWPQYKVFADGRHDDVYGRSIMRDYINVVFLAPDWNSILAKYRINWIFESADARLPVLLMESKDWRLIYADNVANIFLKNIPQNEPIFNRLSSITANPAAIN